MKKIVLVARTNIINPNTGRAHDDNGLHALDGIMFGHVREISDSTNPLASWHEMKGEFVKEHPSFHADRYTIRLESGEEIECTDKLPMHTPNLADEKYQKLATLFPEAVTETIDETTGEVVRAIDKDVLMQLISTKVVEGREERYQFTWPDKKKAILTANAPISATLRPVRDESVDFDKTGNLYIEGDNLDVLKLLHETYLGKVKMIYIDPPYNTGNDFVYEDDFAEDADSYADRSGQYDEQGNRLMQNNESNGRFHTDWLNMIYPRLRIAKDLLTEDGVIFISIDDNEAANLIELGKEIFGEICFVADIAWQRTYAPRNDSKGISNEKEHLVVFSRQPDWTPNKLPRTAEMNEKYKSPDGDPVLWRPDNPCAPGAATHQGMVYAIQHPFDGRMLYPSNGAHWRYQQADMLKIMQKWGKYELRLIDDNDKRAAVCGVTADKVREGIMGIVLSDDLQSSKEYAQGVLARGNWPLYYFTSNGTGGIAKKTYLNDENGKVVTNLWTCSDVGHTDEAKKELLALFEGKSPFDTPKPTRLLQRIITIATGNNDLILDFFSGSATTAHSVMKTNAQNCESQRRYILVQLPEHSATQEYKNLCEVGKERIRRAGTRIVETLARDGLLLRESDRAHWMESPEYIAKCKEIANSLDVGFRVLRLDSSNMQDVYYTPTAMKRELLDFTTDNIKPDRTPEDLLFQVMLDLGVELSSRIKQTIIAGKTVYDVADGFLLACFDTGVTAETVTAIAKQKPYYAVFRDSGMATDSVATNFDQLFQTYSPDTVKKVL